MMKKYQVEIEGITPYMQHRMDDTKLEEWEKNHSLVVTRKEISQEDALRAEFHCYRENKEYCYIPSDQIKGAMINAGTMVKSKVGATTKSMKSIVAAMFFIEPEKILIPNFETIDKRSAVNRNIKGRVIVIRPKWEKWKAEFKLLIDNDTITREMIMQILKFAGNNIGIGSFRPTNNGHYGRFKINELKEIK